MAGTTGRGWLLRLLLLEKVVQHAFVTWALATDRFAIRATVVIDHRWLVMLGGIAGFLFAVALGAHLIGHHWAAWLALGLAAFDLVGEFVAQGPSASSSRCRSSWRSSCSSWRCLSYAIGGTGTRRASWTPPRCDEG